MVHILGAYVLLSVIKNYVNNQTWCCYAAFLYINPVYHSYHTTLLRDDLILSVTLLFVGLTIRVLNQRKLLNSYKLFLSVAALMLVIILGFGLRPELAFLLLLFLVFCFFVTVRVPLGIVGFLALFIGLAVSEELILLFSFAITNSGGLNLIYI